MVNVDEKEVIPALIGDFSVLGLMNKYLGKLRWKSSSHPNVHELKHLNIDDPVFEPLKESLGDEFPHDTSKFKAFELSPESALKVQQFIDHGTASEPSPLYDLITKKKIAFTHNLEIVFKKGKRTRIIQIEDLYDYFLSDDAHIPRKRVPLNHLKEDQNGIIFLPNHSYTPKASCSYTPSSPSSSSIDPLPSLLKSNETIKSVVETYLNNTTESTKVPNFTFIELFAGIGGFRFGLEALGGKCVMSCEINPQARTSYRQNHPDDDLVFENVTCLHAHECPKFDILTAGFPCQPFSRLGRQAGFEDKKKGSLFLHVARLARDCKPAVLFLENVPGLVTLDGGEAFKTVLIALSRAGYAMAYKIVDAQCLVPQYRRRVYIFGIRLDIVEAQLQKKKSDSHDLFRISDVMIPKLGRSVFDILEKGATEDHLRLSQRKWQKVCNLPVFLTRPHWKLAYPISPAGTLVSSYRQGALYNSQFVRRTWSEMESVEEAVEDWKKFIDMNNARQQGKESAVEDSGDDDEDEEGTGELSEFRFLTEREAARVMGFSEKYMLPEFVALANNARSQVDWKSLSDGGSTFSLMGNAVVPPVISILGGFLLDALYGLDKGEGSLLGVIQGLKLASESCNKAREDWYETRAMSEVFSDGARMAQEARDEMYVEINEEEEG